MTGPLLALAGGVGGAKLALGLSKVLPRDRLVIIVNTGDDEEFHGLHVSPDLDTMMYTLAGLVNPETGWGLQGDTFRGMEMLITALRSRYGIQWRGILTHRELKRSTSCPGSRLQTIVQRLRDRHALAARQRRRIAGPGGGR